MQAHAEVIAIATIAEQLGISQEDVGMVSAGKESAYRFIAAVRLSASQV